MTQPCQPRKVAVYIRPVPRSGTGSGRMAGSVADGAAEFEAKLASLVRENGVYGAAAGVVHGDELAWSGGAGFADMAAGRPAGSDVLYRVASITKSFTGTAIMQLRDAGKLALDDPVLKWVPELAGSATPEAIGGVTIRRLLSHQARIATAPPDTDLRAGQPSDPRGACPAAGDRGGECGGRAGGAAGARGGHSRGDAQAAIPQR